MNNHIFPCLWMDNNGREAATFYCDIFKYASVLEDNNIVEMLGIFGQKLMLLNADTKIQKNASISFTVTSNSEDDIQRFWDGLSEGGMVLMPLDSYPWSKKYGWVKDKYDVTWQLYYGELPEGEVQRMVPTLMFIHENKGKAKAAMEFYTSIFPESMINSVLDYGEGGEDDIPENVQHAQFTINDYTLFCMDNSYDHKFYFNEGISLVVECKNQEEIDYYWNSLTANGGEESMCGWLKDKYGVSWQIIPENIIDLLKNPGAMDNMTKMKKIIIEDLKGELS